MCVTKYYCVFSRKADLAKENLKHFLNVGKIILCPGVERDENA